MKYPPGFTPSVATEVQSNAFKKSEMEGDECLQNIHDEKVASEVKMTWHLSNPKDDKEESICSGHFKKAELPRSRGSMLQLMDDLVKVGQTMGYNMEGCLMGSCPNISVITLDRYLSDHRPILMRESHFDYGPIPFRFFHYWFEIEGFDKFVKRTWNDAHVTDSNAVTKLMKKMKYLKEKIRAWIKFKKDS
ncbi:hypothetical protein Tco_0703147 [Tanacetum coccineum]|uniref:RNA-directed DNA polymerase, eukaryota n=1 Tax=Tanacetum coccineum TaxID=301880 RepID=A0ABQ4XZJ6_9ASTR